MSNFNYYNDKGRMFDNILYLSSCTGIPYLKFEYLYGEYCIFPLSMNDYGILCMSMLVKMIMNMCIM